MFDEPEPMDWCYAPIVSNKPIIDKKNDLASSIPAQKVNGVAISNSQKLDEPEPMDWCYTPEVREIVVKNKPLIEYRGFFKQNRANKDKFDEPEPMDWCYTPEVREIVVKNKPLIEYRGFFKKMISNERT